MQIKLYFLGDALNFNANNQYVAIRNLRYSSSGLAEVSVCAWVRTSNSANQAIASFDRDEYWRLEINGNGGAGRDSISSCSE